MTFLPTIADAVNQLEQGRLTVSDLLTQCLDRIERYESALQAWVVVDRRGAIEQARQLQSELEAGSIRGPLHGIPVGIKDIVDVAGLPTEAGSELRKGKIAREDALIVTRLREQGALILGKTVTTQFACFDPPATRNPWNLAHTPGGSSSGSVAAVATGMCFAALGSQTGGSITRPASYCGLVGWKPAYYPRLFQGVVPVSSNLDHVGTITSSVADLFALTNSFECTVGELDPYRKIRIGVLEDYFLTTCDEDVQLATRAALEKIATGKVRIVMAELPVCFQQVHEMHRRIMAVDAAEYHRQSYAEQADAFGPAISSLIEAGLDISAVDYAEALRLQKLHSEQFEQLADNFDVLLTPSTPTIAPGDLSTTGDPRFNSPWSYTGQPTVSIPCGLGRNDLPCGLQLIASRRNAGRLLAVAEALERLIGFAARPDLKF